MNKSVIWRYTLALSNYNLVSIMEFTVLSNSNLISIVEFKELNYNNLISVAKFSVKP